MSGQPLRQPLRARRRFPWKILVTLSLLALMGLSWWMMPSVGQERPQEKTEKPPDAPVQHKSSVLNDVPKSHLVSPMPTTDLTPPPVPPLIAEASPPVDDGRVEKLLQQVNDMQNLIMLQMQGLLSQASLPKGPSPTSATTAPADDAKRRAAEAKKAQQEAEAKAKAWKPQRWESKHREAKAGQVLSPYTIVPSQVVNCVVYTGVSTDAPTDIVVKTTETLWDLRTGRHELLPQDTRFLGSGQETTLFGDARIKPTFRTMVLPNGQTYQTPNLRGADASGKGGWSDLYDAHWGRLLASIVIQGVLRGGTSMMVGGYGGDTAERMAGAMAAETVNQGGQQARQYINTSPTLEVRRGFPCTLTFAEKVELAGPYVP